MQRLPRIHTLKELKSIRAECNLLYNKEKCNCEYYNPTGCLWCYYFHYFPIHWVDNEVDKNRVQYEINIVNILKEYLIKRINEEL